MAALARRRSPGSIPTGLGLRRPDGRVPRPTTGQGTRREDRSCTAGRRRPRPRPRRAAPRASGRSSFDPRGEILARARVPIEPYVSPQPGWAEQDPELYWRVARRGVPARLGRCPARRRDAVAGIALTTQRAHDRLPSTRTAIRSVRRSSGSTSAGPSGLPPIGGVTGLAFRALGVRETVAAFQADAEANWIRRQRARRSGRRTADYLFLSGFLTHRLIGRSVDSSARQVGYVPFDYKRPRAGRPRATGSGRSPRSIRAMLPELVPPDGRLGDLTPRPPRPPGHRRPGTPLVAAAADKACEVLGVGRARAARSGRSRTARPRRSTRPTARYVEAIPLVPPYPAAVPGA